LQEVDSDADGMIDNRQTGLYTYDAAGNQLASLHETDNDANGVKRTVMPMTRSIIGRPMLTPMMPLVSG